MWARISLFWMKAELCPGVLRSSMLGTDRERFLCSSKRRVCFPSKWFKFLLVGRAGWEELHKVLRGCGDAPLELTSLWIHWWWLLRSTAFFNSCSGKLHLSSKKWRSLHLVSFFPLPHSSGILGYFFFKGQLIIACRNKHSWCSHKVEQPNNLYILISTLLTQKISIASIDTLHKKR